MNRKIAVLWLNLMITLGFIVIIVQMAPPVKANTIYVPTDYTTIQEAINMAIEGDTVFVYSGTYFESVNVDKIINLTGENRDKTIIDGSGGGVGIYVSVDWVNITGFNVTNCGINPVDSGIKLDNVHNCRIAQNNIFSNDHEGIHLYSSSYNIIADNNVFSNSDGISMELNSNYNTIANNSASNNIDIGIYITSSIFNTISNNIASDNRYGIHLTNSRTNTLINNQLIGNSIHISGQFPNEWNTHNIDTSNTVNGKPVFYWKNQNGGTVPPGAGEVILANCQNIRIENQDVSGGTVGIELGFSNNNYITNNTVSSQNMYGIHLCFSDYNTLTNNTAQNGGHGFYFYSSGNNILTNNNISYNDVKWDNSGIVFVWSDSNTVTNNNVYSNSNCGIAIDDSGGNTVKDNIFSNNGVGIGLTSSSSNNNITNNNFSSIWYGIFFSSSGEDNNIINNNVSSSDYGIYLRIFSDNNNIISNYVCNCDYGIYLSSSGENDIINNKVYENVQGIYLTFSNLNNIINNNVSNNFYGIYLEGSLSNNIYHNNIIDNTAQGYDTSNNGNQWDDGYPSGGNYWSDFDELGEGAYDDYNGPDQNILNGDGIVDKGFALGGGKNPYVIDPDSQDNYPLIEPYKNYIILKQGWNLISIPLIQEEQDLKKMLVSIDGLYDAVQWYNLTEKNDHWKHHKVGKSFGNDLTQINETMGFWIHITQPGNTVFFINGTRIFQNQTIKLHEGWNLVGYPSRTSYNRTDGLNNLTFGDDVKAIWSYNASTQKWIEMKENDYFEIGRGYWVYSNNEETWEVLV
jgi:parallel beta-helix repeat protein